MVRFMTGADVNDSSGWGVVSEERVLGCVEYEKKVDWKRDNRG